MDWAKKTILLTGGTGSFGQKLSEVLLGKYRPKAIRIFSRDELKQWEMQRRFKNDRHLRFLIGDVRDTERVERAMDGVDIVVHAAALKQVPMCEYNPFEAVKTNILGAENIINAAIDHNVEKVMAISSDKAVNPVNLYGATKMCMEKLFISANAYVGSQRQTRMSCVRYGNVLGSRGSVAALFNEQKNTGTITITDKRMTRFWITLGQVVSFVISSIERMQGGEVFVPRIPSMKVLDFAEALVPGCKVKIIGIRPGEKIHECLLTEDEARHALACEDFFIIEPEHPWWPRRAKAHKGARALTQGFRYSSEHNSQQLTKKDIKRLLKDF